MNHVLYSIIGILIPFIGTSFGSSFVLFMKNNLSEKFQKTMTGFAAGVMIAASVWSLILPSVEMAEKQSTIPWIPATVGLILGVMFLIFIDKMANIVQEKRNGKKLNMLLFSVTLHNIPEGMAVGVGFAAVLAGSSGIELIEAMLLAIGIAIQNIPEGAIISMPLKVSGQGKKKSFIYGVLSGVVEPIASILTILLINIVVPALPYLLTFAAGAMIFVVVEELIPQIHEGKKSILGVIGFVLGFIIMMILDIALG